MRSGFLRSGLRVRLLLTPHQDTPRALDALTDGRARFLAFLERRVGSREVAEDILQEAYVRGMDRLSDLRDAGSVTAWFYRMLRNALADHWRRRDVERRALEQVAAERGGSEAAADPELYGEVCSCASELLPLLKPEYAQAIRRVDLDGVPVKDWAREAGITANNAAVRLHRAHRAMRGHLLRVCGDRAVHEYLSCRCAEGDSCG